MHRAAPSTLASANSIWRRASRQQVTPVKPQLRIRRGSAAAPTARCRKFRRGSFILNLPLRSDDSITSSAIANTPGGTASPSAFAVFMLIASTNLVGCITGNASSEPKSSNEVEQVMRYLGMAAKKMRQSRKSQSKAAHELSARDKLSAAADEALQADFAKHGPETIAKLREPHRDRYVEAAVRRIATVEKKQDRIEKPNSVEEIARHLLRNINCAEDLMTTRGNSTNRQGPRCLIAELERIRDAALGPLQ
jgi:hypothetical protein